MNPFIRLSIVLMLFALLHSNSYGQKCLTSIKRAEILHNNPQLAEKLRLQEKATQNWISENTHGVRERNVVTLPVVVHVIWRLADENISTDQILSQIQVLNEDFRKLNFDFDTGPAAFQPLGADVEIEFCLASVDPLGSPTDGITRTQTSVDDIGFSESYYRSSEGGKDAWDVNQYINIWICDLGEDGTLGFAYPPGVADPPEADGMVIAPQFFGYTGTAVNSYPNDLGRTTTHEMGHYFNLEHVWGPDQGGCNEDDFINDTPLQEFQSEGCYAFPAYDNCTVSGDGIMFNNFMDYSDDECLVMFTEGQKIRILAALNGPRASLLTSSGCSGTTAVESTFELAPEIFPNPVQDKLLITFKHGTFRNEVFTIYSAVGEKMTEFKAQERNEIHVNDMPQGVYFLVSSNPVIGPKKFIVSKG